MRSRAVVILVALVAVVTVGTPRPAQAAGVGEAGGTTDGSGGQVVVVVPGSGSGVFQQPGYQGGWGGGSDANIDCAFFAATSTAGAMLPGIGGRVTDTSTLEEGAYLWIVCRDVASGEITFENLFPWDPANPPVITPSAEVLAQMAANGMTLPVPGARTWPPSGATGLVHLPVWLHVDNWRPLTASATAGGLTATVEAVPVRSEWDLDDGSVVCTDAGSVYEANSTTTPDSSSCSFIYQRSSGVRPDQTFHNSVVVVWRLRWFATNGQGGDLGEVISPRADFELQIEESQALVTPTGR